MATINASNPTLLDQIKRTDPNGAIAQIVETLTQRNQILKDATFIEGNLPTGHRFTSRTALPSVGWRRYNEGIASSKSRTDQVDESCGQLEGNSIVDCELAKLNGNEAAFRSSENVGFLQAFNNEMETGFFYHSTLTNPEKFMGLSPRFAATTQTAGGSQVLKMDASASGSDQASMWLVCWSPETVFGIYPKGSSAGLTPHDMGEQLILDANNNRFRAYVMNWNWKIGLCVKDWRFVVRIANIDTGNLLSTGNLLLQAMVKAYHQLFDPSAGRCVFYCNRLIATYLHLQAMDAVKNSTLKIESVGGQPVTTFLGIPIRETDALLSTEAALS